MDNQDILEADQPDQQVHTDSEGEREFERIKTAGNKLLIPHWLTSANESISKFSQKLDSISISQKHLQSQLQDLKVNKQNFDKLSQMKSQIWDYTRHHSSPNLKLIQIIHPIIMVEIYLFASSQPYVQLLKHRRVSSSFNRLHRHEYVVGFFGSRLLGFEYSQEILNKKQDLCKELKDLTRQYVFFVSCFRYYKEQDYVKDLPYNSFLNDLIQSLKFVNNIFQMSLIQHLQYQAKVNEFLIVNHGVLALQRLSCMGVPILKKNALQALINHLSANQSLRSTKVIQSKDLKQLMNNDQTKIEIYFNCRVTQILNNQGIHCALVRINKRTTTTPTSNVKVTLVTWPHQLVQVFDGEAHARQGKIQISGSNSTIYTFQDPLRATLDSQPMQGVHSHMIVDKVTREVQVFLNDNVCMILQFA